MDKDISTNKTIEEEISEVISLIWTGIALTPINDATEQKKFLDEYSAKRVYNPQFEYKKKEKSIAKAETLLYMIKSKNSSKIHDNLLNKLSLLLEFSQKINTSEKLVFPYGVPDKEMVSLAKIMIPKEKALKQDRTVFAKDAKKIFIEKLKEYNIYDWKIVIKKNLTAKADINSSKKTISLKHRKYSYSEINNLLSHEIDVHVLRAHNGYKNKNSLYSTGTANYLKTEEGLAIMMEQLSGNYNSQRFKFFAARMIAANMAITKSFYEIFDTLVKKYSLSKHNSYIITKRVKRGLTDTSKPGGFIKDHVYFEGFYMIRKFMQSGGDIRPLFVGKISLDEIKNVKKDEILQAIIPKAVEAHYQYRSKQMVLY